MTCLNCVSVKIFWNKCVGRKFLFKRFKKTLPILVLTFIEYGELNEMILRLRLRPLVGMWIGSFADGFRDLLLNTWWMVGIDIYMHWIAIRFSVWSIGTIC